MSPLGIRQGDSNNSPGMRARMYMLFRFETLFHTGPPFVEEDPYHCHRHATIQCSFPFRALEQNGNLVKLSVQVLAGRRCIFGISRTSLDRRRRKKDSTTIRRRLRIEFLLSVRIENLSSRYFFKISRSPLSRFSSHTKVKHHESNRQSSPFSSSVLLTPPSLQPTRRASSTALFSTTELPKKKKGYEPKWKKKATLADAGGAMDYSDKGITGQIDVTFQVVNSTAMTTTTSTKAFVGQPLRDVASQAGQFIKYGCGKGECGTCACQVNGQWIRPCTAVVPPSSNNQLTVMVPQWSKAATVSSGKFYSARSFIMGFWNNLLGMVGFVKARRAARASWQERQDYEELIRIKTMEKRAARLAREAQNQKLKP